MRWVLGGTVLVLGVATLIAGLTFFGSAPSRDLLSEQKIVLENLRAEVEHLSNTNALEPDQLEKLLPERQSMEQVLSLLNTAAKQSGVGPLTLETETTPQGGSASTGDTTAIAPLAIRCKVEVEADFTALTRFLGLIESSVPVMRIESLELTPRKTELRAIATLRAFYYAGEAGE